MNQPLVSLVMPAFNAEAFLARAIQSVVDQSYSNWQLIIVDNGSTDQTVRIAEKFESDDRIELLRLPENLGVSGGRNAGLSRCRGSFLAFIDADDELPSDSIQARLDHFNAHPDLAFVDGYVERINAHNEVVAVQKPSFRGVPFNELLTLSGRCFIGITWMIKVEEHKTYRFKEGLTHGEDLLFCLSISKTGHYDFINRPAYRYRQQPQSAMQNLDGLTKGYAEIARELSSWSEVSNQSLKAFRKATKHIMVRSYAKDGEWMKALSLWLKS